MTFVKEEELKLDKPLNHEVGLVEELQISITKNCELSVELEKKNKECTAIQEKFNDLEFSKIAVDNELKECKRTNDGLKERIIRLELEKSRAENETEIWKKRCRELETRLLLTAEEESSSLRCLESGNTVMEPGSLRNEVSYCDKGKKELSEVQSENGHKKEKMFGVSNHPSPLHTGSRDVHVTGPMTIDRQREPCLNTKEHEKNAGWGSSAEVENRARKKIDFEIEEKKISLLGLDRVKSAGIIEISDSEDEKEISSKHTCNTGGKENLNVSTGNRIERCADDVIDPTSKMCSKGPFSDQRGEEDGVRCEAGNTPSSSTPKRKRCRKIVFSDSESEDDDTIPIGKLMMKKTKQLTRIPIPKLSPLSPYTRDVVVSSVAHNVEELVTPSRRRLLSQRQCEEKKSQVDETSNYENMSLNNVKTGASSQEKVCNLTAENDEELEVEDAGSESEGDSLGGFIVQDGESSDSGGNSCESSDCGDSSSVAEDTVDSDLDFDQIKAAIERRKTKESKWQFEADMLSSFVKDPILCMKAVCALYRQQTAEEKSIKGSLHLNKRGFSKFHALRGTYLAEFLSDGSQEGDLVKSVKELEMFDPKGLEDCTKLAIHYSKQLFTIYQNKEDPLFIPS
ncbi:hypothetical protein MKX01_010666 [Papaver californicum]|nr:hypothetical protein MKX01_010666 [Papaver californicum]